MEKQIGIGIVKQVKLGLGFFILLVLGIEISSPSPLQEGPPSNSELGNLISDKLFFISIASSYRSDSGLDSNSWKTQLKCTLGGMHRSVFDRTPSEVMRTFSVECSDLKKKRFNINHQDTRKISDTLGLRPNFQSLGLHSSTQCFGYRLCCFVT